MAVQPETDPGEISALHFKPSVDIDNQKTRHKDVKTKDDQKIRLN